RTDRPHIIDRGGAVGAVEEFLNTVGVFIQRLIFEIIIISCTKSQMMFIRRVDINPKRILTFIKGVPLSSEPISATNEGVRNRPHIQNANAIKAQPINWNDIQPCRVAKGGPRWVKETSALIRYNTWIR